MAQLTDPNDYVLAMIDHKYKGGGPPMKLRADKL
jgi:hypothetical protein